MKQERPSEQLDTFIRFARRCQEEHKAAFDSVGEEDKRLQDLLHAVEFSGEKYELHAEALKLRESRRVRRRDKDQAELYREMAQFFQDAQGQKVLSQLSQLLGRQRKQEQYLEGHREYRKRVSDRR